MRYGIVICLLVLSCKQQPATSEMTLEDIFNSQFEHSLISRGDNFPDFPVRRDSVDLFLVSLHSNIDVKTFQQKAGWTDDVLHEKIAFLISKGWLLDNDGLKPTIFIASNAEGFGLMELAAPISSMIAQSIEEELPEIEKTYMATDLAKQRAFASMSFLILSDVLLDNWQINRVEEDFLQKEKRPERHGKYYYYSIIQNPDYPKEKFGIYGNQFGRLDDTTSYGIYGNNRITFMRRFKADPEFRDSLISNAPLVSAGDDMIFQEMADAYRPTLLSILNKNRDYMNDVYHSTGYAGEISFEEFFIWWYHLIYTDATNLLALNGDLIIPEDGNAFYITE